jgi:hypothetical protein
MAAETQYTVNTGMVNISTANANLDGTGTLGTVLTAAANGTNVKSVTIKAKGSTTAQGMVRLFVYDGVNTRLIGEVEIPVVTQSATDECFEKYLDLDLDLKAGYILKASTQIADNFNIFAEGLDWSYFTAAVRPESTNYTANTGIGTVSIANANLDGTTGTVATILTAGSSATYKGCMIKSIVIKALGSPTTDGMIRLFIQNTGSTVTQLLTEVPTCIVTQSATARSFVHQIDFPGGFNLQAGYKLLATTEKANSFSILAEAMDFAYPTSSANGLLGKNFTPASGTAVITEEILHSYQVAAGLVASGDLLESYANIVCTNNANNKTFRMYVNTSNSLIGATLLATYTSASFLDDCMSRFFPVTSDTAIECYAGATQSLRLQYATATVGTSGTVVVPSVSAGFWFIISGQKAVAGDTDTVRWSMIRNSRV